MPSVATRIAETLVSYDTDYYFCVTGGDHDLWIALHDAGIKIINCRNEAAAAYMADGYARVSGRPGYVYGQRGPGVANVAAALADALWAHSPVVSLTSSIALRSRDRFEYQDVDGFDMHRAVTRWNRALQAPDRIADMIRAAIRMATGPVPGPVHLEVPADVFALEAPNARPFRQHGAGEVNAWRMAPGADDVARVADLLTSGARPVILAGHGVVISQAWQELSDLARLLDIPVATTVGGKGSIDEKDRLAVGVIGRYSRRAANEIVRDADLVLAIGTQLGGLATHAWSLPLGEKTLIHVDTNVEAIGLNYETDAGVVADAKLTLRALADELKRRGASRSGTAWSAEAERRVADWRVHAEALVQENPEDGIHPAVALAELHKLMGDDDLLAADTGAICAWGATLFDVPAGRTFMRSTGSLGWVVPGAMGAALARPDRRTVALTGDGGLLYHIGELETALRCEIPLVIVVLNNRAFGSEHHLLKHRWGGKHVPEVVDFYDSDFAAVARGFGAFGVRVEHRDQIADALEAAFAAGKPALVDILVSKEAEAPTENFRGNSPV